MINNVYRIAMLAVIVVSLNAATNSIVVLAGGVDNKKILFPPNGKSLADGQYLRHELMDSKARTYSFAQWWESPPIFSEFDVKRTTNGYQFEGGNLREGLVSFAIDKNGYVKSEPVDKPGVVENKPCFQKFCISEIRILDEKSFAIVVNGKQQKFLSTAGFRRVEPAEK